MATVKLIVNKSVLNPQVVCAIVCKVDPVSLLCAVLGTKFYQNCAKAQAGGILSQYTLSIPRHHHYLFRVMQGDEVGEWIHWTLEKFVANDAIRARERAVPAPARPPPGVSNPARLP